MFIKFVYIKREYIYNTIHTFNVNVLIYYKLTPDKINSLISDTLILKHLATQCTQSWLMAINQINV